MPCKTRLLIASAVLGGLTAGCESEQESRPLSLTVPVALLLLAALPAMWIAAHAVCREIGRRVGARLFASSPPLVLRYPGLTAALAAAPVIGTTVVLWPAGCFFVATDYAEPTRSLFSWEGTVMIMAVFGLFALVVGTVSTLVAAGLTSGHRRPVRAAQTMLTIAVVGLSLIGWFGLLWVPALAFSFVTVAEETVAPLQPTFSR